MPARWNAEDGTLTADTADDAPRATADAPVQAAGSTQIGPEEGCGWADGHPSSGRGRTTRGPSPPSWEHPPPPGEVIYPRSIVLADLTTWLCEGLYELLARSNAGDTAANTLNDVRRFFRFCGEKSRCTRTP
jgi:hypothetical protein